MNESFDPILPPQPDTSTLSQNDPTKKSSHPSNRLLYWLKRFLACNPFYLVSVGLLLFGCYWISLEPKLFNNEVAHLVFNFGSLQMYEFLLAFTAIFLARRRIWYDSNLLFGLENLLLLVPFILISQAGLIDRGMLGIMCISGGLLAVGRLGSLKRFLVQLNFPRSALLVGWLMIAANVVLPVVYRILHESKIGNKLEAGAAYYTNECAWLLLLPALCALALLLPREPAKAERAPNLSLGLFGLWLIGTAVHLYCLGYVYDFSLRVMLVAPGMWVLAWVLYGRLLDLAPRLAPEWRRLVLVLPLLAPLAAWAPTGSQLFIVLMLANSVIYTWLFLNERSKRLALHLGLVSVAAMVSGVPESWSSVLAEGVSRPVWICGAVAAYLLIWAARSRQPQLGICGALISAAIMTLLLGQRPNALHWGVEIGFVFLLLHSLRWMDLQHTGARTIRFLAAGGWVAHAVLWMELNGAGWMPCLSGGVTLALYFAAHVFRSGWGPRVVPLAALLVSLSGPAHATAGKLESVPLGVLAVTGSFVLFGLGTVAALTRHRWHH